MPFCIGFWNALRPEIRHMPPARLLMTAHRLMQVVLFALLVRLPEFPGFALASADADIVLDDHPVHYAQSQ